MNATPNSGGRPADEPAVAHDLALAQLVEANARRQRERAAGIFGTDPDQPHEQENE